MRPRTGRRDPTTALAFMASAAVLALCGAVVDPFLDAAGDTAVQRELDHAAPGQPGLTVEVEGEVDPATVTVVEEELDAALAERTSATERTVQGDPVRLVSARAGEGLRVRPVARSGAADGLELVDGRAGDGLLVPEILAEELEVAPGGTVEVARGDVSLEAEVAGVYRTLSPETAPPALAELAELAEPSPAREGRPLDLVFAAPDAMVGLLDQLEVTSRVSWRRSAPPALTGRAEARELQQELTAVAAAAEDPRTRMGGVLDEAARSAATTEVGLRRTVHAADQTVASLEGPVRAVATAGQVVALLVVGAAAGFAAQQRQRELRIAAVRGSSPLTQGVVAAVRATPALLAGVVVGTASALGLVALSSPIADLAPDTLRRSAAVGGVSALLAMAAVVAVTAAASQRMVRIGRRRPDWLHARWPWELAVLGLAAIGLAQLRLGGGVVIEDGAPSLHPLVLLVPVLLLIGGVGLLLRIGRRLLPGLRVLGTSRGPASFLAARRLAGARGPALLLTGATALALGAVVYSATLGVALEDSVATKSRVAVGAEAAVTSTSLAADEVAGTEVHRARGRLGPDEVTVDVLLVDPGTIGAAAGVDGLDVGGAVDRLERAVTPSDTVPVLLVGTDGQTPTVVDLPGTRTPIEVVARPTAFPGQGTSRPLLVATRDDVLAAERDALDAPGWSRQVWVPGPDAAERLQAAGISTDQVRDAAAFTARPRLVAVSWALLALQGFGVLTAALALTGVLLFAAVRQHDTRLSYALARRMGLAAATHRLALVLELVGLLVTALLVAVVLGLGASASVVAGVDPAPQLAPPPRLIAPLGTLLLLGGLLVGVGVLGGLLLHRSAERAEISEVLRGG